VDVHESLAVVRHPVVPQFDLDGGDGVFSADVGECYPKVLCLFDEVMDGAWEDSGEPV